MTPPEQQWEVRRELVTYGSVLEIVKDAGTVRYDDVDLEVGRRAVERYGVVADDFTSATGESTWTMRFHRDDWDTEIVTHTEPSCDDQDFHVSATLDAYEGPRRVFLRTWNESVPRDLL
ncbi:hypothetical protein J2S50_006315 [Streptomyces sp. DSM 40167]|nr:hypothetical protein [Streptomyces sp. DSM 40167]